MTSHTHTLTPAPRTIAIVVLASLGIWSGCTDPLPSICQRDNLESSYSCILPETGSSGGGMGSQDGSIQLNPEGVSCPDCGSSKVCAQGMCCPPAVRSGSFKLPAHTAYVRWNFDHPVDSLEWKIDIKNDPGSRAGLYIAMESKIDDHLFYFGIQTRASYAGGYKGVLISRFDTTDMTNVRPAAESVPVSGTDEGPYISLRRAYSWEVGTYTLKLTRVDGDTQGDWFHVAIADQKQVNTNLGAVRFQRSHPSRPATIQNRATAFYEVYSGAADYKDVPMWWTASAVRVNGEPARSASSEYPSFPYEVYPNSDAHYEPANDLVHVMFGGQTARCHLGRSLFSR